MSVVESQFLNRNFVEIKRPYFGLSQFGIPNYNETIVAI